VFWLRAFFQNPVRAFRKRVQPQARARLSFFAGGKFLFKKFLMQQMVRFPRFAVSIRA
jgi:hypothetical protein